MNTPFKSSDGFSKSELESGDFFAPRFDEKGLITVVTTDFDDNTVLMVAYMNAEALRLTLETGIAHYWSRSRNSLWKKGETSGNMQQVLEMRTDCDQDVIVLKVRTGDTGANCHTGRKSCLYRIVRYDKDSGATLVMDESDQPRFDPDQVYK